MGKIYKNGIEYGGGGGQGSGGHEILDTDGTSMAAEPALQFTGLDVTDDSTNSKTEVAAFGLNSDSLNDVLNASVSGNQVASNGMSYTTSEQVVGKWIDGKPIYQKTVNCGALSNAGAETITKTVAHSISDFEKAIHIFGYGCNPTSGGCASIPNVQSGGSTGYANLNIGVWINSSNIILEWMGDRSGITETYITIQYTKTTD